MKAAALFLLFVFCSVECGRKYVPIDKNANIDFIQKEGGGVRVQPMQPAQPVPKPAVPSPTPTTKAPVPVVKPVVPQSPTPAPKPVQTPTQPKPTQPSTQPKPVPVNPVPAARPITTPGPGSVKSLVNFYDSQGKGSVIRPYSYSQAVKQG